MSRKYQEELAMFDNSEVMHEFLKVIAYDSGLSDYDEDEVSVGKSDHEGSKDIEDLYDTKATTDQDEDGDELIEGAHDKKVEILNSYLEDAGEYKNSIKTHKIMEETANKPPRLYNVYHKNISAINDLMNELIVVADEMDVRGHADLVAFADEVLNGITNTGESVKKNLIIHNAAKGEAVVSSLITALKYIVVLIGGAALAGGVYAISKRIGNGKVYSIEVACSSFCKSVDSYLLDNKDKIDDAGVTSLKFVKGAVEKFRYEYYSIVPRFTELFKNVTNLISGPQSSLVDIDAAYKEIVNLSSKVDQLSVAAHSSFQNAVSNIRAVQVDMENKGTIEGARTNTDAFIENVSIAYQAVSGTSEQLLVDNFNKVMSSIEAEKSNRGNRVNNLKNQIDTYKKGLSVEDTQKAQEQNKDSIEHTNKINQTIDSGIRDQSKVTPANDTTSEDNVFALPAQQQKAANLINRLIKV